MRRNGDIRSERKVVSASIRPTAPMLNSVGSAATPRKASRPEVMLANKAIAATTATPMLKGFTTSHSPRQSLPLSLSALAGIELCFSTE